MTRNEKRDPFARAEAVGRDIGGALIGMAAGVAACAIGTFLYWYF